MSGRSAPTRRDWYGEMWHDPQIRDGILLSFRIGLIAAAIAIVLGTLTAIAVDRFDFPASPLLRFCVVLPITLPGIVTGVAMLSFFSVMGLQLSNRTIIIGHTTFCITLILNNVVARLSQIPAILDEASADLGATPWRTFWRVTFPLILPAILSGGILAFTLSFDEIVVTLFLKGRDATLAARDLGAAAARILPGDQCGGDHDHRRLVRGRPACESRLEMGRVILNEHAREGQGAGSS